MAHSETSTLSEDEATKTIQRLMEKHDKDETTKWKLIIYASHRTQNYWYEKVRQERKCSPAELEIHPGKICEWNEYPNKKQKFGEPNPDDKRDEDTIGEKNKHKGDKPQVGDHAIVINEGDEHTQQSSIATAPAPST